MSGKIKPSVYLNTKSKNILQFFAKENYLLNKTEKVENKNTDSPELTVKKNTDKHSLRANKQTKPGKKIYERHTYDLGDGAKFVHILKYVNDPNALFDELKNKITWRQWEYSVYEKEVKSPRLMNILHFENTDDNTDLLNLLKIKERVEKLTKVKFMYAVLNYYRDGNDYVSYHSDRKVKHGQTVVSVTVGATRRFNLKHRTDKDKKYTYLLAHGDVLILNDCAIRFAYKHSVPKMTNVGPRINITFRE